jgi:hypothetical protein
MQLQLASENDWRAHPMLNLLAVHYVFSSSFPGFLKATLPSPGTPMHTESFGVFIHPGLYPSKAL